MISYCDDYTQVELSSTLWCFRICSSVFKFEILVLFMHITQDQEATAKL